MNLFYSLETCPLSLPHHWNYTNPPNQMNAEGRKREFNAFNKLNVMLSVFAKRLCSDCERRTAHAHTTRLNVSTSNLLEAKTCMMSVSHKSVGYSNKHDVNTHFARCQMKAAEEITFGRLTVGWLVLVKRATNFSLHLHCHMPYSRRLHISEWPTLSIQFFFLFYDISVLS